MTQGVQILLACHNGAAYLPAQLASFTIQRHQHWQLRASDDDSRDATPALLAHVQAEQSTHLVRLSRGPGQGVAAHFLHLLATSGPEPGYLALADQDDVWLPGKLERAMAWLGRWSESAPVLYCSRVRVCDAQLRPLRLSPALQRPANFANALVQNIVIGHTVVLNPAAAALAARMAAVAGPVVMHDWWLYQLITGAGGRVLFDPEPQVLYRQHAGNQVGAGDRPAQQLRRLGWFLRGRTGRYMETNLAALGRCQAELTPAHQALLSQLRQARGLGFAQRLRALRRLPLYRQSRAGTIAFRLALALGRV